MKVQRFGSRYPHSPSISSVDNVLKKITSGNHSLLIITCLGEYVFKGVSFGSKDCTKELKPECAYFLGQTS